ncbi:MAG: penicillin acylase family protein, partial [Flavobacteriaceae bacterium]
ASLLFCAGLFYAGHFGIGSVPPLGKFINPHSGFWQNETTESEGEQLALEGLSAAVTVHYDAQLIPHVFAENDLDLYLAQGYLTAKHRLWQMEFQTYAAAGRLSEIVGSAAIDYDRGQRRKGMVFGAENALDEMLKDPVLAARIEAYSEGVNTYIDQLEPKDHPVEYKLLNYAPEPWQPLKSALLLMYMTDMLAGGDADLENSNFISLFGKETFDLLFPEFLADQDPVIPQERDWSDFAAVEIPEAPSLRSAIATVNETLEKPDPHNGSNNWAVSAEKSVSGNPLLANDPHLGLNLPSIWYVMQLATPDHNVMGATLPGALGVIIGFNDHIAWGVTNATRDVKDWYKITFTDESKTAYVYGQDSKPINEVIEAIKVKGAETVYDTVRYTHYGPITYDERFKGNGREHFAMKWIGHEPNSNQNTFLNLNRARNYDDYLTAISTYTAPAQNFVFASKENDIALWIQGKIANKWEQQGKFVLDGSNPEHEWQGYIPQPHNAHTKNPERGFVSSANQHPTDEAYPYYVYDANYEPYRNRVINDFFRSKDQFSVEDFKALQSNNYNLKAAEALPVMISLLEGSGQSVVGSAEGYLNTLKSWNYLNDESSLGASIWEAWWTNLYDLSWDEFEQSQVALHWPDSYQTVWLLKYHPEHEFFDRLDSAEKEDATAIVQLAFEQATKELDAHVKEGKSLEWASYKATYVGHLLQALPAFSRFDLPVGGNGNIVNAMKKNHGPSWRMIVELGAETKALGAYPGGQSGNPGSKHYDDILDTWAAGEYYPLLYLKSAEDQTSKMSFSSTLNPKS